MVLPEDKRDIGYRCCGALETAGERCALEDLAAVSEHLQRTFYPRDKFRMEDIQFTVSDLGIGFDSKATTKGTGLRLTSMQERLRLVGGELSINSQPKRGTTIHARVRLNSGGS